MKNLMRRKAKYHPKKEKQDKSMVCIGNVALKLNVIALIGVNNSKWNNRMKVSSLARSKLNMTSGELDFMKREAVYSSHRAELQTEFT